MQLQEYDTTTRYATKVLGNQRLTSQDAKEEVREIAVEVEDLEFEAKVGQNLGVLAPGRHEIGQEFHFRLYSIADVPRTTPEGKQRFSLCVRRCN